MKNSKKSNKSFNSLKDFIIFSNEEGYTELKITDFDVSTYNINFEEWLSKEKGLKKNSDSYKIFLKGDILFEFLRHYECIDENINIKDDSSISSIVDVLKASETEYELAGILNVIRFGYRSNNINRFIKDNNLDGLFRNLISKYYNILEIKLKPIPENGEIFLENFFDWFYSDIIPIADNNSKHSGSDESQNLRMIGKFELKLAEKLKHEYPNYFESITHNIEEPINEDEINNGDKFSLGQQILILQHLGFFELEKIKDLPDTKLATLLCNILNRSHQTTRVAIGKKMFEGTKDKTLKTEINTSKINLILNELGLSKI